MTGSPPPRETRQQRLARQLRANLRRRKAQARALAEAAVPADEAVTTAAPLPKAEPGG